MQFLPPFIGLLIDAIAFREDTQDIAPYWHEWKADYQRFYNRESDHSLSEHDTQVLENLPPQFERLSRSIESALEGRGGLDELIHDCNEFFTSYDTFQEEREKRYFVDNPPLDRLLKVAVANLQGRAALQAVKLRIPEAVQAVGEIAHLLASARGDLPNELVWGTEQGLTRAERGFALLSQTDPASPETVEEAVFELKSAGDLLEHLPRLLRRFEDEAGSPLPLVGPLLGLLRQEDSEEAFEEFQSRAWPAFLELWEGRQDAWMLDPEVAGDLLQAADHEISFITEVASSYPQQEESFWDAVERLEEIFFRMRENTLDLHALSSSPYWPEAALMLNLLRGGASRYVAQSTAEGIARAGSQAPPVVREAGKLLSSFLEDSDPLTLLHALKLLHSDYEQSRNSRLCPGCGERIALEATGCSHCGKAIGEFSISG